MALDGRTPGREEGTKLYGIYHGVIKDTADSDRMAECEFGFPNLKIRQI